MYNSHFAVHLKLTQHCKLTILQFLKKKKKKMKMFVNSYAVISRTHCEVKNTNAKQHIQYTTFVLENRESKKAYILLVFTLKKKAYTHRKCKPADNEVDYLQRVAGTETGYRRSDNSLSFCKF